MLMLSGWCRFVSGIRNEVEKVEKQLTLFSDTLDEWVGVQVWRQWRALPIPHTLYL
jgi:hypothetical protein